MGVEKNRLVKPAKQRPLLPSEPKQRSKDQILNVRAKLKSAIGELCSEVQKLEFSSLFRQWKIGNFLFAFKSLSGHGSFERDFESEFQGVLSFRQAQRYMNVTRSVSLAMPLLRERLSAARPDLAVPELSDEQVLKEIEAADLQLLLDQSRSNKKQLSLPSPPQEFTEAFLASVLELYTRFDHVISSEPIALESSYASKIRVGTNPLESLDASPSTVLAVADASKEACTWLRKLIEAHEKESLQALLIVPAQLLESIPELFQFPELLLSSTDIFTNQKKGKVSRYLVVSMIPSHRHQSFLKAFSALGTVKFPVSPKL